MRHYPLGNRVPRRLIQALVIAIEFRRIPYDVAALVSVIRSSGMPYADVLEYRYSMRSGT